MNNKNKINFTLVEPKNSVVPDNTVCHYNVEDNPELINWLRLEFPDFIFDTENPHSYYAQTFDPLTHSAAFPSGYVEFGLDQDPMVLRKKQQTELILSKLWNTLNLLVENNIKDPVVIKLESITVQKLSPIEQAGYSGMYTHKGTYKAWFIKPVVSFLGVKCCKIWCPFF